MAFRRPLKILGFVLGAIVALVVLVIVVVLIFVDPNDYKDRIEAAVEQKTGRQLTLEGDLELAFFPWLAIELGPAQLGQPKGFEGGGPFLVVDKAKVGVKLIPLLRKRLEVSRLGLEGMKVELVTNAEGRTNWEDLLEEETTTEPAPSEGPVIDTIGGLTIKDASLDYRDLQEGTRRRVLDLDVETGAIKPGEPVDVEASVVTDEGPGTATLTAKFTTQLTMNLDEQRYQLARLVLDATQTTPPEEKGGEPSSLTFGLTSDSVAIDLNRQTLALPEFAFSFAGAKITGTLSGEKIVDAPSITGRIAMADTSPRELMRGLGMEIPRTRDPDALKQLNFNANLRATDKSVALDDLRLVFDGQQVTGNFAIADLEKMALRFDLKADRLDLARYEDPTEDEKAKAGGGKGGEQAQGSPEPFKLPVEALRELDAKGTFAIGSLKVAGMSLTDVSFRLDAGNGITRLNPARSHMFGGSQVGNVTVNVTQPVASVNIEEKLTGIDFAELFTTLLDSKRVSGKGNAHAVLSGRGNDSDAILGTLDGRVEFDVQDGAILGADLWYEIQRARALWKKEAMPATASSGMTRFKQLRGTAVIEDGVVTNRDFIMDMDYLKVRGEGSLALTTKKVDYRLTAEVYDLPPASQAGAAELQELKEAEIPVRVSGTLDDLKIRPDLEGLAKARAKQEIEKRKEELQEKALDKLSDWLGRKKKTD